jgi:branched-chain amino acid transport system ATP-binding protein
VSEDPRAQIASAGRRFSNRLDRFLGGPAVVRPKSRTTPPILELRHVAASYGPFRALFDVSLQLRAGTATALLGSNGAGKTTVARLCSGLVLPTEGELYLDGDLITGFAAWEMARLGVTHVPEGRSVFGTLTVQENLELAFRQLLGRARTGAALEEAFGIFPRLADRRRQLAGTLSGGEQRMLSLARIFPDPPRLLIADELSLGLAPVVVDEVFTALARLAEGGTSLLIVEQHVERALALAEHTVLIQKGRIVYDGPTSEIGDALEQVLPSPAGLGDQ